MSLKIRDIKIEDYKEISKIRKKMPGVMENILSNKDEEDELIKEKIINRGNNQYWYVAEEDGKVLGLGILMNHGNLRKKTCWSNNINGQ